MPPPGTSPPTPDAPGAPDTPHVGPLIIYGAGGHGLVVADAAAASGWRVLGFVDDEAHAAPAPWALLDPAVLAGGQDPAIVAIGDNTRRAQISRRLHDAGRRLASVVHPSAWVSPSATIGQGVYIGPRAVVNAAAVIGDGAIINSAAVVEHHCQVGAYAHIAPGAILGGAAQVGAFTLLGLGAAVLPVVRIGDHSAIGAGAVVVADVGANHTVVGVPGRTIK